MYNPPLVYNAPFLAAKKNNFFLNRNMDRTQQDTLTIYYSYIMLAQTTKKRWICKDVS